MNPWLATLWEGVDWAWDRWRFEHDPESVDFDRAHDVDTARWTLDYEPIRPSVCAAVLDALPEATAHDHFVDMGCGKGRVLLIASRRPFASVTGVEVVKGLAAVCRDNLDGWEDRHPECGPLSVLHCDAMDFELPRGDLVLFLYNPFGADVVQSVLDRVRRDHDGVRRVTLAYVNPLEAHLVGEPWRLLTEGGAGDEAWKVYALGSSAGASPLTS